MQERQPAQAQDEQNFLGGISDRRQRVATKDRHRQLLRQQSFDRLLRIGRPTNSRLAPSAIALTPTLGDSSETNTPPVDLALAA
jgi:hypothetical protein